MSEKASGSKKESGPFSEQGMGFPIFIKISCEKWFLPEPK